MEPVVTDLTQDDQYLRFTLGNVNVSIANAVRRIMLAEIPCVVFRTAHYEENRASIEINTSRMNNELIKQRISCIPIHITDTEFPLDEYIVELDVRNDTKEIIYATTADFKIKHIPSASADANGADDANANGADDANAKQRDTPSVEQLFPPDKITGDYIDIVRLRPKISDAIPGEHIKLSLRFDLGTAKQDGAFNVVSSCAYAATPDKQEIENVWSAMAKEMKTNNMSEEDISYAEKDWRLLEAKRITKPDSFDFKVESVGQFEEIDIVKKAADVMKNKLSKFKAVIYDEGVVTKSTTTIPNSFDIILQGEDYTLGKVLEYILYRDYYENKRSAEEVLRLNYCGFQKPHPHIDLSIIRVGFAEENIQVDEVRNLLEVVYHTATSIFDTIDRQFMSQI